MLVSKKSNQKPPSFYPFGVCEGLKLEVEPLSWLGCQGSVADSCQLQMDCYKPRDEHCCHHHLCIVKLDVTSEGWI